MPVLPAPRGGTHGDRSPAPIVEPDNLAGRRGRPDRLLRGAAAKASSELALHVCALAAALVGVPLAMFIAPFLYLIVVLALRMLAAVARVPAGTWAIVVFALLV